VLFERTMLTDEGTSDLYTIPAGGGTPQRLTSCSGDCWGDSEGRFSADGSQIALMRATGPRATQFPSKIAVHVMNADGSDMRQLTDPPGGLEDHLPSWSPDGKTIVFQRDTTTAIAGPTKLMAIDVESGVERLVHALPSWAPGSGNAALAPDGKRILFDFQCRFGEEYCPPSAYKLRNSRLATIHPDGSGLNVLRIELRADSAAWSPSGRQIVFRCHDIAWGSPFALCTSKLDGTQLKRFPWRLGSVHPSWGTHP
jgi:Tol biopolymer transport system component